MLPTIVRLNGFHKVPLFGSLDRRITPCQLDFARAERVPSNDMRHAGLDLYPMIPDT